MSFNQETVDRLTVRDIRELERVMEIMAKFNVDLTTVIKSVITIEPVDTWNLFTPYDNFRDGLESYNKLAEHDGFRWTPPSERK